MDVALGIVWHSLCNFFLRRFEGVGIAMAWSRTNNKSVQRGVRQGDSLSTLLFNLILNEFLQEAASLWEKGGYGTNVAQANRRASRA